MVFSTPLLWALSSQRCHHEHRQQAVDHLRRDVHQHADEAEYPYARRNLPQRRRHRFLSTFLSLFSQNFDGFLGNVEADTRDTDPGTVLNARTGEAVLYYSDCGSFIGCNVDENAPNPPPPNFSRIRSRPRRSLKLRLNGDSNFWASWSRYWLASFSLAWRHWPSLTRQWMRWQMLLLGFRLPSSNNSRSSKMSP